MEQIYILSAIGFLCFLSVVILFWFYALAKKAPRVGDSVVIVGPYDPDRGWISIMKNNLHKQGTIIGIDIQSRAGVLYQIAVDDSDTHFYYNRRDFIVCQ